MAKVENEKDSLGFMVKYIKACWEWSEKYPDHIYTSFIFWRLTKTDRKKRTLNGQFVSIGSNRLEGIIDEGKKRKLFKCGSSKRVARLIQVIITGSLVSLSSEPKKQNTQLKDFCLLSTLELLGVSTEKISKIVR
ncbi:MAG: hypothetical protein ACPGJV_06755 [Bacteriovoracaceae bacterium]